MVIRSHFTSCEGRTETEANGSDQSALSEYSHAGNFTANDELMDGLCPLIGDDAFEAGHVSDGAALDADAAGAKDVAA